MSVEQSFNLDIVPQKNPPRVKVTEYDQGADGWLIKAYLFKDGERWEPPSGATVNIEGTTYEKTAFTVNGTVNRGSLPNITFTLTEDMTGYKGPAWAKAVFTIGTSKMATSGFWLDCDRAGVEADTIVQSGGFQDQVNQGVAEVFGVSSPPSSADDCKVLGIRDSEWKPLIPYAVPIIYTSGVLRSPFTSGELTAETIANIYWQAPYKDKHILFAWDSDGYVYELKQVVTFGTKRVVFHRYDGARETTLTLTESSTSVVKKTIGGVYHVDGTTVKDENNVAVAGQEIIDNFTSTGILPILKRGEAYYHLDAVTSNGIRFTLANIAEFIFIPKGSSTPEYE